MLTPTLKAKLARVSAAAAVAAVGAATVISGAGVAGADPKQFESAIVGVGSDTTQDVLDGLTGEANGKLFTPVRSSAASGRQQLASWRATGSDCITPRAPGASFDRPNGSSRGREALTAAFQPGNGGWNVAGVGCNTTFTPTSGLIDFARSSSGAHTTGFDTSGPLTYVPFGRDALQFLYYAPTGLTPVSTLTVTQLRSLHNNTSQSAVLTVSGTRIVACRIQAGSGTYESWMGNMGLNAGSTTDKTTLRTSTAECANFFDATQANASVDGVQEHDPVGLKDVCDRLNTAPGATPTQCVIGYSAANFVAQYNDVGLRNLPITPTSNTGGQFNMGVLSDLGGGGANQPAYNLGGTPTVASPNTTYYNADFGRDVYNVLPTSIVEGPGNPRVKTMFLAGNDWDGAGTGPAICGSVGTATRTTFGFAAPALNTCGQHGINILKGPWRTSNTSPPA